MKVKCINTNGIEYYTPKHGLEIDKIYKVIKEHEKRYTIKLDCKIFPYRTFSKNRFEIVKKSKNKITFDFTDLNDIKYTSTKNLNKEEVFQIIEKLLTIETID